MADPYVQPNGTLRNNFNISDSQELKNVEYDLTHDRLSRIHNEGPQGPFDFDRLKRTHHHIFQDVYAWAGEPRRIDLFKAQEDGIGAPLSRFDRAVVIGRNAADLFDRLAAANYLAGLPRQEFATRAADYFCEVNQLHPFREGNGRTQRAFFEALAEAAGHTLDFRGITGERMVEASIQAHDGKRDMMHRIFDEATTPNRIAALQHAVAVLDRLGFAHTDQTYVATAAPGQRYSGQFVGRDDRSFMMRADRTIIVGDPADLAAQPDRGERIAFTATGAFLAFSGAEKRQVADDIELFPTKHREAEMTSATQDQPKSAVTDRAEREELSIALDEETTRSAEPNATVPASDAAANSKRKPPAVGGFPLELERRYYVIEDSVGTARRVYADSKGEKELFRDNGDQLKTKIADSQSIKLMLDTAQHRGWEAVKVRGTEDFRREAWLEASARGVAVNGYKPTELDRQELARREKAYLRNEMTEDRVQRGRDRITEGRPARAVSEQAWPAPNYKAGVEGEVLAIGTRPYGDREGGAPTPYVDLKLASGDRHTVWGVGLPDALGKSGVEVGDRIALREAGVETVTRTFQKDDELVERELERRAWDVSKLEGEQEYEAALDVEALDAAQNSLKVRAVGSNDTRTNAELAKAFLEQSRSASAGDADLTNAVALEAYVERKLRHDLGHNHALVERGMNAARHKIADLIRHGAEIQPPRVVDQRSITQPERDARQEQERSERDPGRER